MISGRITAATVLLGLPVLAFVPSALAFVPSALGFGPGEALGYQSPELGPAQAALNAARQRAGAANLGLSAPLSAQRTDGNNSYSAGLNWQWNFGSRLEAALAVTRAERQVRQTRRDGQKAALLAHAGLWQAQSRLAGARKRLEAAQARLTEAERRLALGAATQSQREEAGLALRQAELTLRQAQISLASAQAEAARYGLRGNAEAQTLRFELAEVGPERAVAVQEAKAALELAQSNVDRGNRILYPELSLGGTYTGRDAQVQTGISWTGTGPGANFSVGSAPPQQTNPVTGQPVADGRDEWKLSLGARLTVAPEAFAALSQANAERDLAQVRLDRALEEARLRLPQSRTEGATALESLALAQSRLELQRRQLALTEARVQAGSATLIEQTEAQAAVSEAEAAVAQAWQAYVTAVGAYLDLTDGEWKVQ